MSTGGRALNTVLGGMAEHFSGNMGSLCGDGRIQNRVHGLSSRTPSHETYYSTGQHAAQATAVGRGDKSSLQESSLSGLPALRARFLGDLLLGSEEDRRLEANTQSETTQQVYQTSEVSDGDIGLSLALSYQRQVGSVIGSEGCIPPRSDTSPASEMVTLRGSGPGLCLPVSAIWPLYRTSRVHADSTCGRGLPEAQGGEFVSIPGRLADLRRYKSRDFFRHAASHPNGNEIGICNQLQEIQHISDTNSHLSRGTAISQRGYSLPHPGKGSEPGTVCPNPCAGRVSNGSGVAQGSRTHGQYGGPCTVLQVPYETNSVTFFGSFHSQPGSSVQTHSCISVDTGKPQLVAHQGEPGRGSAVSDTPVGLHTHHGRVQTGLGRTSGRDQHCRTLDVDRSSVSHKSAGIMGSGTIPTSFCQQIERLQCSGSIRQLDRGCLPQQTGRHQIPDAVSTHTQVDQMVSTQGNFSQSETHSWCNEYSRGRSFSGEVHGSDRVVPQSESCSVVVSETISPNNRPLCDVPEQATSGILRQGPRSQSVRGRCTVNTVGRHDSLRISSDISTTTGGGQNIERGMQCLADSAVLAETLVVSANGRPPDGEAYSPTRGSRHLDPRGRHRRSNSNGPPTIDCMAVIRSQRQERGFSQRSSTLIARGRRPSTLRTYSQRLGPFYRWCAERSISPTRASIAQVAEFLTNRFDSGLKPGTVRNYKSAIMSVHKGFVDGSDLDSDGSIRLLLEGMFNERPPQRTVVPMWDLNTVLDYLKGPPFEPMGKATLRYVTLKTVFLVAVATARRVSELHALSRTASAVTSAGATLVLRPDFMAKNESSSFSHANVFIPSIASSSAVAEDRFWCPVRALKYYLDKTDSLREGSDSIFLTHAYPYRPASKQTIARWLTQVIGDAKALLGDVRISAHSVRAMTASWAYHKGLSIKEICDAVSWKSRSTFTTCYFRDVKGHTLRGQLTRSVLQQSQSRSHRNSSTIS